MRDSLMGVGLNYFYSRATSDDFSAPFPVSRVRSLRPSSPTGPNASLEPPSSLLPLRPAARTAGDGDLLALLPERMQWRVEGHLELRQLVQIVMDLERRPLARFPAIDFFLSDLHSYAQGLHHATSHVTYKPTQEKKRRTKESLKNLL